MSVASFVAAQRTDHGVSRAIACRALELSESWFYKWRNRAPTPRQVRRVDLDAVAAGCISGASGRRSATGTTGRHNLAGGIVPDRMACYVTIRRGQVRVTCDRGVLPHGSPVCRHFEDAAGGSVAGVTGHHVGVGVGPERPVRLSIGWVSPARPPNRTCDFHRIRLSTCSCRWCG